MTEYEQLDLVELLEPLHRTKPGFHVQAWHFDTEQTNPRFAAFLHAMNAQQGDEVSIYMFQVFVHRHLHQFKKQQGVAETEPMDAEQHERFTAYLWEQEEGIEL